jgi:DUF4097 and DUF4098 domain-containing protein YvlB
MMKMTVVAMAAALGCAAPGCFAQDKVTVPLSSPGQPVTIKASLMNGSVTVTAGTGNQVTVMQGDGKREREPSDAPPGMHRIDSGRGLNVEEDHNVITISGRGWGGGGNLTIETPVNTSLQIKAVNGGHIDVTGLNGDLDVQETNGSIILKNVSGSVVAHSLNGAITATLDRVSPDKPMSFTSLNGKIDVTLPAATKARLRLKTDNGSIYTDFDVKLEPTAPAVEDSRANGGKYRIRIDRTMFGTINGGGPEYLFQTMNGSILIHKK